MDKKIKILHLETDMIDAKRVNRMLKNGGIAAEILVTSEKEEYVKALMQFSPDVILSDHTLSSFNAREALSILLQSGMNIPFILVNATISEDTLFMIKAGAHDYVL